MHPGDTKYGLGLVTSAAVVHIFDAIGVTHVGKHVFNSGMMMESATVFPVQSL